MADGYLINLGSCNVVQADDWVLVARNNANTPIRVQAGNFLTTHEAAGDPHAQYLTEAEADGLFDALGNAVAEVAAHEAAADPHPGYLTSAEGNAAFQTLDATLTAFAALNSTAGLVEQTGADAFTKRPIGVGNANDVLIRSDGDGRYSNAAHNHDATYAVIAHNHDAAYAALSHNHDAANINSGTMATARLGSGTANASTFLRGDQTYAVPSGGSDPWTYNVLAATFATTSNAVQNVNNLRFVPAVNTNYEFECTLMMRTNNTTTNPRVGLAWSGGLTDGTALITEGQAATGTPVFASGGPPTALLLPVGGLGNVSISWPARIIGIIKAGASANGNIQVQLASEINAQNVSIISGSWLKYRTVP